MKDEHKVIKFIQEYVDDKWRWDHYAYNVSFIGGMLYALGATEEEINNCCSYEECLALATKLIEEENNNE